MQLSISHISQPLKIWEKIEILIENEDLRGLYVCRIEDFIAGGIVITKPEFVNGQTLLRENASVTVMITKDDAIYQFTSRIRRMKSSSLHLYLLSPPTMMRRVQRRQFVRIDYLKSVEFAKINKYFKKDDLDWRPAKSINISGGGLLIKSRDEIKQEDILLLKAELFSRLEQEQPILGFCCRVFKNERQEYCGGIEFIRTDKIFQYIKSGLLKKLPRSVKSFDKKAQEKIVSFVFKEQVDMRKKGLI